jgi:TldD protein
VTAVVEGDVDVIDRVDATRALNAAMRAGAPWAELYVEERGSETVRLAGGWVAEIRTDRDVGAAVRVVAGETVGLAYTNRLTAEALKEAAQAAAAAAASGPDTAAAVNLTEAAGHVVQRATLPPGDVSAAGKVRVLRRADDAARSHDSAVRDVTATHVDVTQKVLVATSDGRLARDERVRTRLTCRVTARREGRTETGFDGPGHGGGLELYETDSPEQIAVRAAGRAVLALEGREPSAAVTSVVLGPGGGGLLLHEACGHGLESDGLVRDISIYARTVGKRVASPLVTAVDDPSRPGGFGSYGIDDEGRASSRTVLLDAGRQVGALTDSATGRRFAAALTANARRASYADPPLPRMSNTYIEPGGDDPAAVVGDVRQGVYVSRLRGGDVNIATGEFAFSAAEAYLIERGRLTAPLSGVSLLGNGPAALEAVDAVCADLAFTQALCSKDDQWVPVSYGAPTMRIARLTVAGQS